MVLKGSLVIDCHHAQEQFRISVLDCTNVDRRKTIVAYDCCPRIKDGICVVNDGARCEVGMVFEIVQHLLFKLHRHVEEEILARWDMLLVKGSHLLQDEIIICQSACLGKNVFKQS